MKQRGTLRLQINRIHETQVKMIDVIGDYSSCSDASEADVPEEAGERLGVVD